MRTTVLLIIICLCFAIIYNTGWKRLLLYIGGILLITSQIIILDSPRINSHRLLFFSFLVSLLMHKREVIANWKIFPLKKVLIISIILMVLMGLNAAYLTVFYKIYKPVMLFLESFFMIFVGFLSLTTKEITFNKSFRYILILLTSYGIITFFLHYNVVESVLASAFDFTRNDYMLQNSERQRISSFWTHAIAYGFVCSLLFWFTFLASNVTMKWKVSICLLLITNLILTNSRTPLLAFIIGFIIFSIVYYNPQKIIVRSLFISFVFLILVMTIPVIQERFLSVVDLFTTGGQKTSGSNLEMRNIQLAACYFLFQQAPVWGNGFDYIQEMMGYGTKNWTYNGDLRGFESYGFILLIEQGIVGIIVNILFFLSLIVHFITKRKISGITAACGLAITVTFLFFAFGTGVLSTWNISMVLIGICVKKICIDERKKAKISNNNTCL